MQIAVYVNYLILIDCNHEIIEYIRNSYLAPIVNRLLFQKLRKVIRFGIA